MDITNITLDILTVEPFHRICVWPMATVFYFLIEKQITRAYCAVEDCCSNCLLIRVCQKMEDECELASKSNRQVSPEFERLVQTDTAKS